MVYSSGLPRPLRRYACRHAWLCVFRTGLSLAPGFVSRHRMFLRLAASHEELRGEAGHGVAAAA
jgi:hypothetical protein